MQNDIDKLESYICNRMISYWGDKLGTITIQESTHIPFNMLTAEIPLYGYLMLVVRLEHSSLGFSVKHNGGNFSLLNCRIDISEIDKYLDDIDREVCLRIPDKYLKAKGWL